MTLIWRAAAMITLSGRDGQRHAGGQRGADSLDGGAGSIYGSGLFIPASAGIAVRMDGLAGTAGDGAGDIAHNIERR